MEIQKGKKHVENLNLIFYFNQDFLFFPQRVIKIMHTVSTVSFPQEMHRPSIVSGVTRASVGTLVSFIVLYTSSGSEENLSNFLRCDLWVFPRSFFLRLGEEEDVGSYGEKDSKRGEVRRKAAISSPRIGQTRTLWFAAIGTGSMNSLWFWLSKFLWEMGRHRNNFNVATLLWPVA